MKKSVKIFISLFVFTAILFSSGCSLSSGKLEATIIGVNDSDFLAKYITDSEKYEYLIDGFDITDEELAVYVRDYNYWQGSRVGIEAVNKNNFDITVIGIEVGKNGENSLTLSLEPRQIVTIPAGTEEPQRIWFDAITDGGIYTNDEMAELIRNMDVKIIYVDSSTGITDLSAATAESLVYEKVK